MKDKYKLLFLEDNLYPKNITASDIQKAFADSIRLEKEITLRKMLSHFKQKHDKTNAALASSGESKRCTPFKSIDVSDVREYIEAMLFDECATHDNGVITAKPQEEMIYEYARMGKYCL